MKKRSFAWEDQRFSSKDAIPLASKLILPEDDTKDPLEISRTAGVFDEANDRALRSLQQEEAKKKEQWRKAEEEAAEEFRSLQKEKSDTDTPWSFSPPKKARIEYSLVNYSSDSD